MTDKDSHPIEYYLEFATASRNLCRIISLDESYDKRELIAHIVTTLQNFPDYLYEDDNFIEILDALVQDGIHQEPSLAEYWGNFLLKLGFAHLERYASQGEPQHIKRAIFLSEMAMTIVSREEFPRLWALFQVLSGDAKRFLQSRPEVSIPLMSEDSARDILEVFTLDALQHYHQALEVIRQDEDPSAWVEIANRLGYAYTEEITGDRNTNLRRAADLFIRIQETWESMGSVKGVAEARIDFADTLVSLNSDDQDIKLALDAYHHALNMLLGIGDKRAEEIIGKINALETVNFTTYYPRTGMPGRKFCFAVYAHLPELLNTVN